MSPTASVRTSPWALGFLWATGLWIGTGAVFKLLWGTPADLPPIVREVPFDIALGTLYKVIIAVEFCCLALALYTPKLAWPVLLGALATFDAILIQQIRAGSEHCGCFGADVPMRPEVMLGIDSALLLGILVTRPWRMHPFHPPGWASLPVAFALAILLPWHLDRQVVLPSPPKRPADALANPGQESPPQAGTTTRPSGPTGYVVLEPAKWVGQSIFDSPLASLMGDEIYQLPLPQAGVLVLWRQDCHECANHLEILATQTQNHPAIYLIQIQKKTDTPETNVIRLKPQGPNVFEGVLPPTIDYVVTTPVLFELDAEGKITSAREGAS